LLAGKGRFGFAMGMLATTRPERWKDGTMERQTHTRSIVPSFQRSVLLFRGCAMQGLFAHVHDATRRTLTVNGYDVREVAGQVCCGALHAHAGLADEARALAQRNIAAFGDGDELIVVNSAGCGAQMKEYSGAFAARVRDVSE